MKTTILAAAAVVACISAFAQGTLNFANGGAGLQAKVTDWNGVGLSGSQWEADLFWAAGIVADTTKLAALNAPATFSTIASQAGFFFGGPRTVPTAPGIITAQVRVWNAADGASWAAASVNAWSSGPYVRLGESTLFQVQLANPNASPPGIPTTMTGLNGHPWSLDVFIPEPSATALLSLGLTGIWCRRRTRGREENKKFRCMKTIIFAAALGVACISAFAQGTLNFANSAVGVDAPVYADWTYSTLLSGSEWAADLFWAAGTVPDDTKLVELNEPATFSTNAAEAGYFFGGPRTIPFPGVSTITAQVRVWDTSYGATWAQASQSGQAWGKSILFQVTLTTPPQAPASLTGLNGHPFIAVLPAASYATLDFANYGPAVNAPVTDGYGHAINGPGFVADLYWAPGTVTDSTVLTAFGRPAPFSTNGYFFGGVRPVGVSLSGRTAFTFQVRVSSSRPGFLAASPLFYELLDALTPNFNWPLNLQPFASGICQTCPSVIPPGLPLSVDPSGSNYLLFSWPWFHPYNSGSEFRQYVALQQNPDLSPTNWVSLPDNPWLVGLTNGVQYQLLVPAPSGTMFYRLRWQ